MKEHQNSQAECRPLAACSWNSEGFQLVKGSGHKANSRGHSLNSKNQVTNTRNFYLKSNVAVINKGKHSKIKFRSFYPFTL